MKRFLALLLMCSLGWAAAPDDTVILVGFPSLLEDFDTQFDLLGSVKGQHWIRDTQTVPNRDAKYVLWDLQGKQTTPGIGQVRAKQPEPCQQRFSVNVQPALHREQWLVATTTATNLRPRAVKAISTDNSTYQAIVRDHLKRAGVAQPNVNLIRITQADLDNDQHDEVILVAANGIRNSNLFPIPHGEPGDYGLVLVRKIVNGTVKTVVLAEDVFATQDDKRLPMFFDLVNVLDLNGDGKLEVVLFRANHDGYKTSVLEWNGARFIERLTTGCGLP
jgi:hypothetical protein